MHPSSLLSYYPTYSILNEITSVGNYNTLHICIDLKNVLQSTYMKHAIVNIVESTKRSKTIDSSVFSALISFLGFHKMWGVKAGINTKFTVFFEVGQSYYHKNISKLYKASRMIDDLYGLEKADRDTFFETMQANLGLIEMACNKLPTVRVAMLRNLEADFIPYYITTRNLISQGDREGVVVYSNDHDLWQCLKDDVWIFSKVGKKKRIIRHGNIVSRFLKRECQIPDEYYPLVMSVIGDPGDDVKGVDTVGPSRLLECFDQLCSLIIDMPTLYDNIQNNSDIFPSLPPTIANKFLKRIVDAELKSKKISNNMKLVSFELISRAIEDPNTTEMAQRKKEIHELFNKKDEVANAESIKKALEMNGVVLETSSIDLLYI